MLANQDDKDMDVCTKNGHGFHSPPLVPWLVQPKSAHSAVWQCFAQRSKDTLLSFATGRPPSDWLPKVLDIELWK